MFIRESGTHGNLKFNYKFISEVSLLQDQPKLQSQRMIKKDNNNWCCLATVAKLSLVNIDMKTTIKPLDMPATFKKKIPKHYTFNIKASRNIHITETFKCHFWP